MLACYDRLVRDRAAYILVGGRSSRFGSDKALIQIEGQPLVARLADIGREAAGEVTLVGPAARYSHLDLPIIPDAFDDAGPLAGIIAALEHSRKTWNLILACDMPMLTAAIVDFLFTRAERGDEDVVLPVSNSGREEPLCAVYGKRGAPALRREIEGGTRKITYALRSLAVRRVLPDEYGYLDPTRTIFTNVNTAEDLREAFVAKRE